MTDPTQRELELDATERIDAFHDELTRLRREVDHTHRLATIGTMAAGVAHEVNNLLTPALSYARMAERSPSDQELARKAVAKAVTGIEAASRVLQAILEFTATTLPEESAAIDGSLQAALDCLGRDLDRQGISLQPSIPPGVRVAMSPLALQQVLLNLLLNAHRVLGPGGQIEVRAVVEPDGSTTITVADNGPGIPEEIASHLFEPFVTSMAAEDRVAAKDGDDPRGGSGLGLAVCRRLVETAGGTIEVHSTPGAGATFEIRVPSAPGRPLTIAS